MLTDKAIRAAMKAVETETTLTDGAAGRGTGALRLVIRRNAGGVSALWFAAWKRDGQRRKLALGRYPDMSLQAARERFAEAARPAIVAGKNPRAAVPRADRPTVERLLQAYVDHMREAGRRSVAEVERALLTGKHNAADHLGRSRLASEIGPEDVAAFLAETADRGAVVQADRCRGYLSAAFNWGMRAAHNYRSARQDWGIRFSPVAAVPRDTSAARPRDRHLTPAEIKALWFGVDGEDISPEVRLAVRLLIACGQRVRETLRARADDFDLDAATWRLPASTTKGGKPHMIPLPAIAVDELRAYRRKRGLLFPARTGKGEHILDTSVAHALRRWCKVTKASPFQTRDLRRTWKTRAGEAGVDRFTRDLIQQHAQAQDTGSRVYDHTDYLPQMRAAMLRWNSWLDRVLHSAPSGLVRPLRA